LVGGGGGKKCIQNFDGENSLENGNLEHREESGRITLRCVSMKSISKVENGRKWLKIVSSDGV